MNIVHLSGRLTADPVLRKTAEGISVSTFTVAVDRAGKSGGTDFIPCTAWRERAESIVRYFVKGSPILITGSLRVESYKDKYGNNRTRTDVNVGQWEFTLSDPTRSASIPAPPLADDFQETDGLDDLPF
ncbi:MAG: single-stranded DNA-binding protein [Oscillospiraceae bacterium]|nr:single-stranded DNA-binding protein [Oscillospiraceae bacterium]